VAAPAALGKAVRRGHIEAMDILSADVLPYKGVAVALWFALFFLGERLAPAAATCSRRFRKHRTIAKSERVESSFRPSASEWRNPGLSRTRRPARFLRSVAHAPSVEMTPQIDRIAL